MSMRDTERRYVMKRIREIEAAKIEAVREKHSEPAKRLTDRERCALLRSGKVKLHADRTKIDVYVNVVDAFDFSKYEHEARVRDEAALDAKVEAIRRTVVAATDRAMLADSAEGLALIAELEAIKV